MNGALQRWPTCNPPTQPKRMTSVHGDTVLIANFSCPLLSVARKVFLRKSLKDMETFERETASFEVELSHADVEGVWQKDGLRIKPNNNWRVSMNGCVHGLTMSNLSLEDTGTIVFSSDGLRTSARLQVKGMEAFSSNLHCPH